MVQRELSGPVASGKTTLSRLIAERFGFWVVSTRELLSQGLEDRLSLQAKGVSLDDSTSGSWVRDGVVQLLDKDHGSVSLVVDSVRTLDQIRWIRDTFGSSVRHIHLSADTETLSSRYGSRSEGYRYEEVSDHPVERAVGSLEMSADLVQGQSRNVTYLMV